MADLTHKSQWVTMILAQVIITSGLIQMIYWVVVELGGFSLEKGKKFAWHPFLMYFGFIFCMASSTLMYRILPFEHKKKKIIHVILHTLGIISVTFGLIAIVLNKKDVKHAHFTSLHSWLGIGTYSIFVFKYISSLLVFLYPKASEETREKVITFHRLGGEVLFILAGIVCIVGMQSLLNFKPDGVVIQLGNSIGLHIALAIVLVKFSLYNHSKAIHYEKKESEYQNFEE